MKRAAILIIVMFTGIFFNSCLLDSVKGDGNVTEETIDVKSFSNIDASRGLNVYITQGNEFRVLLQADQNLHKYVDIWTDDNTLNITAKKMIRNAKSLKVLVTVPNLENIKTSSGSNVFSDSTLNFSNLELKATSGSNIRLSLQSDEIRLTANSGANLFLDGNATSVYIKTSSGSNIKAGDLTVENAEAKASSGANIWLRVNKSLKIRVSSGANFYYSGEPSSTDIEKSSGGNVSKN